MPQRFGQPIDVPYVPQYQPLPIEAIGQTAQQLQQVQDQSLAQADELAMNLQELPTTPAGEQHKQERLSDMDEAIDQLASEGEIREMPRRVRQLAREFSGDMQALQQQYQQYQGVVEQIQEEDHPLHIKNMYMQELQEGDQFEVSDDGHIRSALQAPNIQEYFDVHDYTRTLMSDVRDDTSHAFQTEDGQWISEQQLLESPEARGIVGKMKEKKFPGEGVDPDTGERSWEHSRAATSVATQLVKNPKSRQQIQLELRTMDEEDGGITDDMSNEEIQDRIQEHAINLTQSQIQARSGSDRTYSGIGTGSRRADERIDGVDYSYMDGWSHERRIGSFYELENAISGALSEGDEVRASQLQFESNALKNKFIDRSEEYDEAFLEEYEGKINEEVSNILRDTDEIRSLIGLRPSQEEAELVGRMRESASEEDRQQVLSEIGHADIRERALERIEGGEKFQQFESELQDWVDKGGGITDRIVSPMADGADDIMSELQRIPGRSFRIGPNSFNSDVSEIESDVDIPDNVEEMGEGIFDQFKDRMEFTGFVSPNHTNDLQLQFSFKDDGGKAHHVRLEPKNEHQAMTHDIIGMLGGEAGEMLSEEFQFQDVKQTKNWVNIENQTGDSRLSDLETKGVDDGFQIRTNRRGRKEPIHYGDVKEKFKENLAEVDYNVNRVDQDTMQGLLALAEQLHNQTGGSVGFEEFMTYVELDELPGSDDKENQIENFLNNPYTSERRSELVQIANLLR